MNGYRCAFNAICLGLALAACSQSVPAEGAFANADAANSEVAPIDSTGSDATAAADAAAETAADQTAAGPSCQQALDCLIAAKAWQPGKPPPQLGTCTKGMNSAETAEMDALLGCIDQHCAKELDAWDKGGGAELPPLQLCLVGKCSAPVATCMGGHGNHSCATALKCMMTCSPTDQTCSSTCLAPTTEEGSKKAGNFLACVFTSGCTPDKMATCNIPLSCGLKCPELAGG